MDRVVPQSLRTYRKAGNSGNSSAKPSKSTKLRDAIILNGREIICMQMNLEISIIRKPRTTKILSHLKTCVKRKERSLRKQLAVRFLSRK